MKLYSLFRAVLLICFFSVGGFFLQESFASSAKITLGVDFLEDAFLSFSLEFVPIGISANISACVVDVTAASDFAYIFRQLLTDVLQTFCLICIQYPIFLTLFIATIFRHPRILDILHEPFHMCLATLFLVKVDLFQLFTRFFAWLIRAGSALRLIEEFKRSTTLIQSALNDNCKVQH